MYCICRKFEVISEWGNIIKLPRVNKQPNGIITSHSIAIFDVENPTWLNSVFGVSKGQLDTDIENVSPRSALAMVFVITFRDIGELCNTKLLYKAYMSIPFKELENSELIIMCSL